VYLVADSAELRFLSINLPGLLEQSRGEGVDDHV